MAYNAQVTTGYPEPVQKEEPTSVYFPPQQQQQQLQQQPQLYATAVAPAPVAAPSAAQLLPVSYYYPMAMPAAAVGVYATNTMAASSRVVVARTRRIAWMLVLAIFLDFLTLLVPVFYYHQSYTYPYYSYQYWGFYSFIYYSTCSSDEGCQTSTSSCWGSADQYEYCVSTYLALVFILLFFVTASLTIFLSRRSAAIFEEGNSIKRAGAAASASFALSMSLLLVAALGMHFDGWVNPDATDLTQTVFLGFFFPFFSVFLSIAALVFLLLNPHKGAKTA
ncbi:hypothetical protein HK405_013177 [Cladochytrium tenue]|nr:hypothetical protein HK405_013177 [Cladochytrium tenue]